MCCNYCYTCPGAICWSSMGVDCSLLRLDALWWWSYDEDWFSVGAGRTGGGWMKGWSRTGGRERLFSWMNSTRQSWHQRSGRKLSEAAVIRRRTFPCDILCCFSFTPPSHWLCDVPRPPPPRASVSLRHRILANIFYCLSVSLYLPAPPSVLLSVWYSFMLLHVEGYRLHSSGSLMPVPPSKLPWHSRFLSAAAKPSETPLPRLITCLHQQNSMKIKCCQILVTTSTWWQKVKTCSQRKLLVHRGRKKDVSKAKWSLVLCCVFTRSAKRRYMIWVWGQCETPDGKRSAKSFREDGDFEPVITFFSSWQIYVEAGEQGGIAFLKLEAIWKAVMLLTDPVSPIQTSFVLYLWHLIYLDVFVFFNPSPFIYLIPVRL